MLARLLLMQISMLNAPRDDDSSTSSGPYFTPSPTLSLPYTGSSSRSETNAAGAHQVESPYQFLWEARSPRANSLFSPITASQQREMLETRRKLFADTNVESSTRARGATAGRQRSHLASSTPRRWSGMWGANARKVSRIPVPVFETRHSSVDVKRATRNLVNKAPVPVALSNSEYPTSDLLQPMEATDRAPPRPPRRADVDYTPEELRKAIAGKRLPPPPPDSPVVSRTGRSLAERCEKSWPASGAYLRFLL